MLVHTAYAAEQLTAKVPQGWILGLDNQVGELKVQEFFPPDTEDYWDQKVVYEALTTNDLPEALDYVDGLADQQAERCEEFQRRDIHVGFENQYPTVVSVLQCGINNLTGKPIVTLLKVVKGNRSLYTISRIWRLEPKLAENGPGDHVKTESIAESGTESMAESGTESTAETNRAAAMLTTPDTLIPKSEFAAWSATLRDVQLCDSDLPAHPCSGG
ncbi:MAG: hypothetical protein AAF541_00615 [Pseudomonadota bacterium]